jgi:hypothetical protein
MMGGLNLCDGIFQGFSHHHHAWAAAIGTIIYRLTDIRTKISWIPKMDTSK